REREPVSYDPPQQWHSGAAIAGSGAAVFAADLGLVMMGGRADRRAAGARLAPVGASIASALRRLRRNRDAPLDDQLVPQASDPERDLRHAAQVEELRPAVQAVIVMDRRIAHHAARLLDLRHQLDADQSRVAGELDPLEHAAADQPEVAIHVPALQPEREL